MDDEEHKPCSKQSCNNIYDQITSYLDNTPYLYLFCLKFVNQPVPVRMLVLGVRDPERASAFANLISVWIVM